MSSSEKSVSDSAPPRSRLKKALPRTSRGWLRIANVLYCLTLIGISAVNAMGPERWWVSGLNLYLPQWAWGLPALPLLAANLRYLRRRWIAAPLLGLLWVAGPLMGFCWGADFAAKPDAGGSSLRVMTYNIKYGRGDINAIIKAISDEQPDLLLLQDVNQTLHGPLGRFLRDRKILCFGQYVIASRLPLSGPGVRSISFPGAQHTCFRCQLTVGKTLITVYDVHLLTPREGLTAVQHEAEDSIETLQQNMEARLYQARALAEMIRQERGPVLVAGDLNAPDISLVCRALRQAGLHDAFAEAGRGYGYTYGHTLRLRHSYLRIDHILLSSHLRALNCRAGSALGSDHRPVFADLLVE